MVVLLQGVFERSLPARDAGGRLTKTRQNSEPLAGIGVTHRRREEAETEGQHDDVQHEMLLVAPAATLSDWVFQGRRMQWINGIAATIRGLPVSVGVRCHSTHMFSRRPRRRPYRNFIKTRVHAVPPAVHLAIECSHRPNRFLACLRLFSKGTPMKSLYSRVSFHL